MTKYECTHLTLVTYALMDKHKAYKDRIKKKKYGEKDTTFKQKKIINEK